MSLFRKPKKNIQRRAFSEFDEDKDRLPTRDDESSENVPETIKMKPKPDKVPKERPQAKTLLSFGDEEGTNIYTESVTSINSYPCIFITEEEEVFQVKKTSQSKKVMRQLDKERRRKAKGLPTPGDDDLTTNPVTELSTKPPSHGGQVSASATSSGADANLQSVREDISGKKIHTEIRTDDFVVRLLLSNTTISYSTMQSGSPVRS